MSEQDAFPTALADDPPGTQGALGWTATILAVATLLLALFNAADLDDWANELTPSPLVGRLVAVTGGWRAATERLALSGPRDRLHAAWKVIEGGSDPAARTSPD